MAFTFQVKRSTSNPTANSLAVGELGYNTSNKQLFVGNGSATPSGVSMDGHTHNEYLTTTSASSTYLPKSWVTNSLTSTSTSYALSAAKGRELKNILDNLEANGYVGGGGDFNLNFYDLKNVMNVIIGDDSGTGRLWWDDGEGRLHVNSDKILTTNNLNDEDVSIPHMKRIWGGTSGYTSFTSAASTTVYVQDEAKYQLLGIEWVASSSTSYTRQVTWIRRGTSSSTYSVVGGINYGSYSSYGRVVWFRVRRSTTNTLEFSSPGQSNTNSTTGTDTTVYITGVYGMNA